MVKINIICIGKIKEKYLQDAINEYSKRLSKYCKLKIIELPDKKIPDNSNLKERFNVRNFESNELLSNISKDSFIICLDLKGTQYTSEEFANKINNIQLTKSSITFIIGGSLGFNDDIRKISNLSISFSKMTFPHQLFRVILLEQIYRAFKINNNETYHK